MAADQIKRQTAAQHRQNQQRRSSQNPDHRLIIGVPSPFFEKRRARFVRPVGNCVRNSLKIRRIFRDRRFSATGFGNRSVSGVRSPGFFRRKTNDIERSAFRSGGVKRPSRAINNRRIEAFRISTLIRSIAMTTTTEATGAAEGDRGDYDG